MRLEFGSAGAGASWRALVLKTAGAHSTMRVRAPAAPALTHSLHSAKGIVINIFAHYVLKNLHTFLYQLIQLAIKMEYFPIEIFHSDVALTPTDGRWR